MLPAEFVHEQENIDDIYSDPVIVDEKGAKTTEAEEKVIKQKCHEYFKQKGNLAHKDDLNNDPDAPNQKIVAQDINDDLGTDAHLEKICSKYKRPGNEQLDYLDEDSKSAAPKIFPTAEVKSVLHEGFVNGFEPGASYSIPGISRGYSKAFPEPIVIKPKPVQSYNQASFPASESSNPTNSYANPYNTYSKYRFS